MTNYPRETERLTTFLTQNDYDQIHVCSECKEEYGATHAGDDVLGYCHYCQIVEGDTEYVFENNNDPDDQIDQDEYDKLPESNKPN